MTPREIDAELSADPTFAAVCDARRDAWIAALEAEAVAEPLPWHLCWEPEEVTL